MHTKERCWGCARNENRQDGVSARADLSLSTKVDRQDDVHLYAVIVSQKTRKVDHP